MATKKLPSMEDAVTNFKQVMTRASLKDYSYVNRIMLSKNPKGQSILIVPEQGLWDKLVTDKDFMSNMSESTSNVDIFKYGEEIDSGTWIEVDPQVLYNGSVFKISIDNLTYELLINKNMIPVKLKKAEANDIWYRVFLNPSVLVIKKKLTFNVDGGSFVMLRMMKIL